MGQDYEKARQPRKISIDQLRAKPLVLPHLKSRRYAELHHILTNESKNIVKGFIERGEVNNDAFLKASSGLIIFNMHIMLEDPILSPPARPPLSVKTNLLVKTDQHSGDKVTCFRPSTLAQQWISLQKEMTQESGEWVFEMNMLFPKGKQAYECQILQYDGITNTHECGVKFMIDPNMEKVLIKLKAWMSSWLAFSVMEQMVDGKTPRGELSSAAIYARNLTWKLKLKEKFKGCLPADVYSFGVLVLEIVSGRTNLDTTSEDMTHLLDHYHSDKLLELLDKRADNADDEQVISTQATASQRPAMSKVVAMLTGSEEVRVSSLLPGCFSVMEPRAPIEQRPLQQCQQQHDRD
ncbi:hypothetical protein SELMODRAFT_416930 [Selaginella moellendorffii]|uniref:Serine-threonine/tyrosine-protein kinase catalytic domain-containing protein n=1 Tax=Selaginella moellendorffii TaxID=88036 RepID=D8S0U7_SELML|nr:hypothetical protein SELMODRAFT_416930 [Selaginella moellendorffii]